LIFLFTEEPSLQAFVRILVSQLFPTLNVQYKLYQGKQDFKKNIRNNIAILSKQYPHAKFMVVLDKDSHDCKTLKAWLKEECEQAGLNHTQFLIRIVCTELESWYLGDLEAISKADFSFTQKISQKNKKFRDPDRLANAKQELQKLLKQVYVPTEFACQVALQIANRTEANYSLSFQHFLSGIEKLSTSNKGL
jgi:hypothetical protein